MLQVPLDAALCVPPGFLLLAAVTLVLLPATRDGRALPGAIGDGRVVGDRT